MLHSLPYELLVRVFAHLGEQADAAFRICRATARVAHDKQALMLWLTQTWGPHASLLRFASLRCISHWPEPCIYYAVEQLITAHGAQLSDPVQTGCVLYFAAKRRLPSVLGLLLQHASKCPNARMSTWLPNLMKLACVQGHPGLVAVLLRQGACPNAEVGRPLKAAAEAGSAAVVCQLLDAGADVHAGGDCALRICAAGGSPDHVRVLDLLLTRGADVHARADEALSLAVERGNVDAVAMLLRHGASAAARQVLETAAAVGSAPLVRLLLQHGADPQADGGRPLLAAASAGAVAAVRELLQAGALQVLHAAPAGGVGISSGGIIGDVADATGAAAAAAVAAAGEEALCAALCAGHAQVAGMVLDAGVAITCAVLRCWRQFHLFPNIMELLQAHVPAALAALPGGRCGGADAAPHSAVAPDVTHDAMHFGAPVWPALLAAMHNLSAPGCSYSYDASYGSSYSSSWLYSGGAGSGASSSRSSLDLVPPGAGAAAAAGGASGAVCCCGWLPDLGTSGSQQHPAAVAALQRQLHQELCAAAAEGSESAARLFLAWGARGGLCVACCRRALQSAASNNHPTLVDMLLSQRHHCWRQLPGGGASSSRDAAACCWPSAATGAAGPMDACSATPQQLSTTCSSGTGAAAAPVQVLRVPPQSLHLAISEGHLEVVRLLLVHGAADVHTWGPASLCAAAACRKGNGTVALQMVQLLLAHGAGAHAREALRMVACGKSPTWRDDVAELVLAAAFAQAAPAAAAVAAGDAAGCAAAGRRDAAAAAAAATAGSAAAAATAAAGAGMQGAGIAGPAPAQQPWQQHHHQRQQQDQWHSGQQQASSKAVAAVAAGMEAAGCSAHSSVAQLSSCGVLRASSGASDGPISKAIPVDVCSSPGGGQGYVVSASPGRQAAGSLARVSTDSSNSSSSDAWEAPEGGGAGGCPCNAAAVALGGMSLR